MNSAHLGHQRFILIRRQRLRAIRERQIRVVVHFHDQAVGAYCHAFGLARAAIGEQPARFEGARVWVLPNPSGLNANYQLPALVRLFHALKRATE